ncbi:MAG TPA: GTP cyclohydrolase II [Solibacterales bacterium]|jgi:GTP cyclohydrolase II|nr:GTP cyclohydrolase II [Bryobacterales bacterium]
MQTPAAFRLVKAAEAAFPSEYGQFRIHGFEAYLGRRLEEAVALTIGDLAARPPLVRVHSQCLTGDVLHSLRCDCRDQLDLALTMIAADGAGLLIYEQKEGRGIGLMNKLRAYELQDRGADTVEANRMLGFESDLRNYELPAAIVRHFGITRVRLLSNNPEKVEAMQRGGIEVVERVPVIVAHAETRRSYLETKRQKMGHLLEGF